MLDLTPVFIVFVVVGLPVLAASALVVWIATLTYRYKLAELDIRTFEARSKVRQARLAAGVPEWLDSSDPVEIAAWQQAQGEVVHAAARAEIRRGEGQA